MHCRGVQPRWAAMLALVFGLCLTAPAAAESEIGGPRYYEPGQQRSYAAPEQGEGAAERADAAGTRGEEAGDRVVLVMSGMIGRGSYREFRRAVSRSKAEVVVLEGPGGILGEALLIAEEVRRRGLTTIVAADRRCASACAIIFLAGRTKHMGPGAAVGLHAASFENGVADPQATSIMAGYLRQLGVPSSTLQRMASTAPQDIRWLTRAEKKALRIRGLE
jgi:hypothetical protein